MGPTNVALVKLYRADQALRDARERLDVATKNVRLQERRCTDLAEKLKAAQTKHRELQVRGNALDLDMKSRDAHIERLRNQQQSSKNNKEYQSLLIEINTRKVDRAKVDEEAMKVLEQTETTSTEVTALTASLEGERTKVAELKSSMGDTVAKLQAEIDTLQGPRDELAKALPPKARDQFDKLADHHEGEALAAIIKPDRRKEEYACSGCMMDLVTDVYNKLHTRDDMVFCPSCRRILYIPDDLPPEMAVNSNKKAPTVRSASTSTRSKSTKSSSVASTSSTEPAQPVVPPRPKSPLDTLLTLSQGESVKNAVDADQRPLMFTVTVDGKDMGQFKAKNADNLERIIKFRMEEQKLSHSITVAPYVEPAAEPEAPSAPTEQPVASA